MLLQFKKKVVQPLWRKKGLHRHYWMAKGGHGTKKLEKFCLKQNQLASIANQSHWRNYLLFWGLLVTIEILTTLAFYKSSKGNGSYSIYFYLHLSVSISISLSLSLYIYVFFSSHFHIQEWSLWTNMRIVSIKCITKRKLKRIVAVWPWISSLFLMNGK